MSNSVFSATSFFYFSFFLSVDLCHPLLVGVLSDREEKGGESKGERKNRREVFLRVKQGLLLEVDVQHGRETCRLELDSLARVETTNAAWTRGVRGRADGRRGNTDTTLLSGP